MNLVKSESVNPSRLKLKGQSLKKSSRKREDGKPRSTTFLAVGENRMK